MSNGSSDPCLALSAAGPRTGLKASKGRGVGRRRRARTTRQCDFLIQENDAFPRKRERGWRVLVEAQWLRSKRGGRGTVILDPRPAPTAQVSKSRAVQVPSRSRATRPTPRPALAIDRGRLVPRIRALAPSSMGPTLDSSVEERAGLLVSDASDEGPPHLQGSQLVVRCRPTAHGSSARAALERASTPGNDERDGELSSIEIERLGRRVDLHVLLVMAVSYLFQSLDSASCPRHSP